MLAALMDESACAQKQAHLDDPVEQHMQQSRLKSIRCQQHDAKEHIAQIADG